MEELDIVLCQTPSELGNKDQNVDALERIVKKNRESDLIIFPELYLSGYVIRDKVFEWAEPITGKNVARIRDIAKENDIHIIFGMAEKSQDIRGQIYNSAVFVYPDGNVYSYKKTYLVNFGPFEEKLYYTPGNRFPIFCIDDVRIGVEICYDIFFPEITKYYALAGVDMVVCISASPTSTRKFFQAVVPSRAIEDTVFVAYANVIGTQRNLTFWGGDMIVSPRGKKITEGPVNEEAVVKGRIRLDDLEFARRNRPTIRDTRPEILEKLCEVL